MLYLFYIFQSAEMFPGLERQWRIYVSIQLLFAYLTRYSSGTDQLRYASGNIFVIPQ